MKKNDIEYSNIDIQCIENYRFERKFLYEDQHLDDVISTEILLNPCLFKEIYSKRKVNNIYFDDSDFSSFKSNVAGIESRKKFRLRWYGNELGFIRDPTFEIKKKIGLLNKKFGYSFKSFQLDTRKLTYDQIYNFISDRITDRKLSLQFQLLSPSLFNSYERSYFISACGKYRITIDDQMTFWDPRIGYSEEFCSPKLVLELKYKPRDDDNANIITQSFNSRLTKNSKYVLGCELIY